MTVAKEKAWEKILEGDSRGEARENEGRSNLAREGTLLRKGR